MKTSGRAESGDLPASLDWRSICRVGIGKGLPAMADYGISSSLIDQLSTLPEGTDPSAAEALYARLEALESKYSGPQNSMPREVREAPDVAVWERGFSGSALRLVEGLGEPVLRLEEPREPAFLDEEALALLPPPRGLLDADAAKQRVVVLPTGSLYGLRANSAEHAALESFVQQGGVVVCFTQPYGDDFSALPVPAGDGLISVGYKQDLSCFANSAVPAGDHPILSGITGKTVTAGFDGFFRKAPRSARVLLRRAISNEPCLIFYPVGQGWVVVTTMYEDWGSVNGQSSRDGRSIVGNLLAWAKDPNRAIPANDPWAAGGPSYSVSLGLAVRNLSGTDADQVEVLVVPPSRSGLVQRVSLPVNLPAHSQGAVPVSLYLGSYFASGSAEPGIFHADYRLLARDPETGQEAEIQPQGETDTGRFVMRPPSPDRLPSGQTVFSVWTDDDVAGNPAKTVHLHIEDLAGTERTVHLWTSYTHETGILLDTITLPARGAVDRDIVQDLSRPGPYHYYLMDPVYGFVPSPSWDFMWGYDPWKMAAQGYAFMFGNNAPGGNPRFVELSPVNGLRSSYEPIDTVSGSVTVTNPSGLAEELTVVFTLAAADRAATQAQTVRVVAGASQEVPFSLALPGPVGYYRHAIIGANVYRNSSLMAGRSAKRAVEPWLPQPVLTADWPTSATLEGLPGTPVAIRVGNQTGPRVADCAGVRVRAQVWDVTRSRQQTQLDEALIPVPDLRPGESADVVLQWQHWQAVLGRTYSVQAWVEDTATGLHIGGYLSKTFACTAPSVEGGYAQARPGETVVALQGTLRNSGDLEWSGQLAWECSALGIAETQEITIAPRESQDLAWTAARPEALAPGSYPYSLTLTASGAATPLRAAGSLLIAAPAFSLNWPAVPPEFRHDRDAPLLLTVSASGLAAPLSGTLDAEMTWEGGSGSVASQMPVVLDPESPTTVTLPLPVTRMPGPGGFSVRATLRIAQGGLERSWNAAYFLQGPEYRGGLLAQTAAPGDSLGCQIQNAGRFEGSAQVTWTLTDAKGATVARDSRGLLVGIGEVASFEQTLPPQVLPGVYASTLVLTDAATGVSTVLRQDLAVTGSHSEITLFTDRTAYSTGDPVLLSMAVSDPEHALEGGAVHLEIQRYLGMGGQGGGPAGPPGASWNTPGGDGDGNHVVGPSRWFVDPLNGRAAYARDVSARVPPSQAAPVSADINGDGKAEIIGASGLNVQISSQGELQTGAEGCFHFCAQGNDRTKAGARKRETAAEAFQDSLVIPASTWIPPGEAWETIFLLGFRDDGPGCAGPLCLGLGSAARSAGALFLVRLDGTVLWRHDFPVSTSFESAQGPFFSDLNSDGTQDVLFEAGDTVFALDGASGDLLWAYACPGYSWPALRVGRAAGNLRIWVAYTGASDDTMVLLDASGQEIYKTTPPGGLQPFTMVAGDVDGDGDDEAVVTKRWQAGYPPLEVFRASDPVPEVTAFIPNSPVSLYDLDGDGKAEALYLRQVANSDGTWTSMVEAALLSTGGLLWSTTMPTGPQDLEPRGLAFLPYLTPAGERKLAYQEYLWYPSIRESAGSLGRWVLMDGPSGRVEQVANTGDPSWTMVAGDFDGDGVSEICSGDTLLDDGCMDGEGVPVPCADWEAVWQADQIIHEGSQASITFDYEAGEMARTGTYRAVALVATVLGQETVAEPAGFSVTDTALGLSVIAPAAGKVVRADEEVGCVLTVVNNGDIEESGVVLSVSVDGQMSATWDVVPLGPGDGASFDDFLPPASPGEHTLEMKAVREGTVVAEARSTFISAAPRATVAVNAPDHHTEAPFEFTVSVDNTGDVPAFLDLTPSDDPGHALSLALQPGEGRVVTLVRQSTTAYAAQVTVSGDAPQVLSVVVPYAYQLTMDVPDLEPQPAGALTVPLHLVQAGPVPYAGAITATLTQADGSIAVSDWPVQVLAGGVLDLDLDLPATVPGRGHLHLQAALTEAELARDFAIYRDGIGSLQIALPQTLGEGPTEVPFTVRNGQSVPGNFTVQLLWTDGGSPQVVAEATLSVQGGGLAEGILAPSLAAGTGTLEALLNGVQGASQPITVVPRIRADLTLNANQAPDGPPSATAIVQNTGFAALDAVLEVRTDTATSTPVHLEPGEQIPRDIPIYPDAFAGDSAPVTVILLLPGGMSIERSQSVALSPAQLSVSPPASGMVVVPGQASSMVFTVVNAGDQEARVMLALDFEDGELGHAEQTAAVPGHATIPVAVSLNLLPDIPNGASIARYTLRRVDEAQVVLSQGEVPVIIDGPTVLASASLDGVAYPVGAFAMTRVTLSLSPPSAAPREVTVRVIGGAFEEERFVTVSSGDVENFSVPVGPDTDSVSAEVIQPGGRSLYLDRFRIYPLGAGFGIFPDKSVCHAGESVTVSATLPALGSLDLSFLGEEATLQGSGQVNHTFSIPTGTPEESYSLSYTYTPANAAALPVSGSLMVDVHGILVTAGESHLDRPAYVNGEDLTGQVVLYTNQALAGMLKFWLVGPDGTTTYAGDQSASLHSAGSVPNRFDFALPFATSQAGTHRLAFSLEGASGVPLVSGSLPFRAGAGVLLSVATDQDSYPLGTEPVSAILRASGSGPATAVVEVDGRPAAQGSFTLAGVQPFMLGLGAIAAGEHGVKATLVDSAGLVSTARCRFVYGAGLPDLMGAVSGGCRTVDSLPVYCTVTNVGAGPAAASTASLYDGDPQTGGILLAAVPVMGLAPGEQDTFTYDWGVVSSEGVHQLHLVADSQSAISEWDESNNGSWRSTVVEPAATLAVSPPEGTCSALSIVPVVESSPTGAPVLATLDGVSYLLGSPVEMEGEHELTVKVLNECGGAGAAATLHYVIDSTNPTVEIGGAEEGRTYSGSVAPTFVVSDAHLAQTASFLNGQPFISGTPIADPGDYELTVSAADCAGNEVLATVHFAVTSGSGPALPPALTDLAWFGCDSLGVTGSASVYGVSSIGGPQGFGGHVASNGSISITGTNVIDGNATPGPGHLVTLVGGSGQVLGSITPAVEDVPCYEQLVADWLAYATNRNDNDLIPGQFLDPQGNFKVNGSKTCILPSGTYLVPSFTVNGAATLVVNGPTSIVVTGAVTINGSSQVNCDGTPSDLVLVSASAQSVTLSGSANVNLEVFAPLSNVTVNGSLTGYGNLWGKTLVANGSPVWSRVLDATSAKASP